MRAGTVQRYHDHDWIKEAREKGVIDTAEEAMVREVEMLTAKVIAVDHFDPDELRPNYRTISNTTTGGPTAVAAE